MGTDPRKKKGENENKFQEHLGEAPLYQGADQEAAGLEPLNRF